MTKRLNARAMAAQSCWQIVSQGQSLDSVLSRHFTSSPDADRGLIQEIVYGVCRWHGELNLIANSLIQRPLKPKDRVIHYLLLVGLYQLRHLNTAQHAAVSETVNACQQLSKPWAKKLINGCLRRWLRESDSLNPDPKQVVFNTHPEWLIQELQAHWPEHVQAIGSANNQRPPMILRVNQRIQNRADYLHKLEGKGIEAVADDRSADAVLLNHAVAVAELPGFTDGHVSVQDTAAQIAADVLKPSTSDRVLDACAAPGGKAAHLLERVGNQLELDALDVADTRTERLHDTLNRLGLRANCYTADATQPPTWPVPDDGYDHILIDAPCSGTGVIRRHPDIKHHRRASDIPQLQATQAQLLSRLWRLLKPGGQLLYMTCSILPQENDQQIAQFLCKEEDVEVQDFSHPDALRTDHGWQTLQGVHNMDGFYYSLLRKKLRRMTA